MDTLDEELVEEIETILDNFQGEESLKELFWEVLSYDRQRAPLPLSSVESRHRNCVSYLEVFAKYKNIIVLLVAADITPERYPFQHLCKALIKKMPSCIMVFNDRSTETWTVIYPDETKKTLLRFLPLPGLPASRRPTALALASLCAVHKDSQKESWWLEITKRLEVYFPGEMPRIGLDFANIDGHFKKLLRSYPTLLRIEEYLENIARYPLLTIPQEQGEGLKNNGKFLNEKVERYYRYRLIVRNLRLVVWLALKMPRARGMQFEDCVQEGNIGLMTAADRFDPTLGNRFSTYAYHWIRQKMLRAIVKNWSIIRWPAYKAEELIPADLKKRTAGLQPGERQTIFFSELPAIGKKLLEDEENPPDPLEGKLTEIDCKEDEESISPEERILGYGSNCINGLLKLVDSRASQVLRWHYGIDNGKALTLEQIGQRLNLTRERIRQIELEALGKLRKALEKKVV